MAEDKQIVATQEASNSAPMSIQDLKSTVQRIQEVMQYVMKKDVHYGVIPGTGDRPTLLKPGSEKLLSTFHIAVKPVVEDLSTDDQIRYRVTCEGRHQATGVLMGAGIGECSSSEEKYAWRRAVVDAEFDDTDPHRRRVKYNRKRDGSHYTIKQVRQDPANVANTVLKMAKKRAEADLCLTVLACSDIFSQDLEDLPPDQAANPIPKSGSSAPRATTSRPEPQATAQGPDSKVTEGQIRVLRSNMDMAGVGENLFLERFNIRKFEEMPFARMNEALEWLKECMGSPPE